MKKIESNSIQAVSIIRQFDKFFYLLYYHYAAMKYLPIFLIFILVLIGVFAFFGLYEARFFTGNATATQKDFSSDNSYVFISPLRAQANNQEQIRTTVFVLNNQGLGVEGRQILLENSPHLTVSIIQGTTDPYGKAVFDIVSNQAGEYYLEITVDGKKIPQRAHLTFY